MAKKRGFRHRLLVYRRLGQRWRTVPLLLVLLGGVLFALGWLTNRGTIQGLNTELLTRLWEQRILVLSLIGFSLLLYIVATMIANSYVEVQPKALYVRAGLVPQHISYGRVRQLRVVQLSEQYPAKDIKRRDYALLEPYYGNACTAVDLKSWPKAPLKKLWHHLMFTREGQSLLFVVEDGMVLNQQIDGALAARHARYNTDSQYQDPIERAVRQSQKSRRG